MKTFQSGIFCALFIAAYTSPHKIAASEDYISDGKLNMTQIIRKYGFEAESHDVQTDDGYIITIFRIPPGPRCGNQTNKLPVILQHGVLSSSYDFVTSGPSISLAFILARNCWEVWIGNSRGNEFGRRHATLESSDPQFWDFSWHEIGYYDLPAIVDHVLKTSNQKDLHYVGFSQGTTVSYVFGALRPEYHDKIRTMHSMSPIAFMKHIQSPAAKILSQFSEAIDEFTQLIGLHDLRPFTEFIQLVGSEACSEKHPYALELCASMIFMFHGFDEPQLNKSAMSAYMGHTPTGAAVKQLLHYAQLIKSGQFRQFDYGPNKNLEIYQSVFPPDYNVSAINIPTALYHAQNDRMAPLPDVMEIKARLPIVAEDYEVPYSKFTHVDFVIAIDAKVLVYDKIMEVMNRYE